MKGSANVYIDRLGSIAIVVTLHQNQDDVWFEDDVPTKLIGALDVERAGAAVLSAMGRTERRVKDMRSWKVWPALEASGVRSMREFEQSYVLVEVNAANDSNLVAIVTGSPEKGASLRVTGSVSMQVAPAKLGDLVIRVFEACRDRRL